MGPFSRHQHHWEVIGSKYHQRDPSLRSVKNADADMFAEATHGFTLLTQRCTECGWVEGSRVAGELDLSRVGGISTGDQT